MITILGTVAETGRAVRRDPEAKVKGLLSKNLFGSCEAGRPSGLCVHHP